MNTQFGVISEKVIKLTVITVQLFDKPQLVTLRIVSYAQNIRAISTERSSSDLGA
jgi:hypothetical protein